MRMDRLDERAPDHGRRTACGSAGFMPCLYSSKGLAQIKGMGGMPLRVWEALAAASKASGTKLSANNTEAESPRTRVSAGGLA